MNTFRKFFRAGEDNGYALGAGDGFGGFGRHCDALGELCDRDRNRIKQLEYMKYVVEQGRFSIGRDH